MKLIVGLGNPGKEYQNTRHNIGFNFLDYYVDYKNLGNDWIKKFDGLYMKVNIDGHSVIFLKPQTYMNLSGNSVRKVMDYYDVNIDDVLVISDDLDLSIGNYKLKSKGSCKDKDTKDYVLGNLSKDDKRTIDNLYKDLCPVIDDYFKLEFTELMNKYNHKNR